METRTNFVFYHLPNLLLWLLSVFFGLSVGTRNWCSRSTKNRQDATGQCKEEVWVSGLVKKSLLSLRFCQPTSRGKQAMGALALDSRPSRGFSWSV